MSAIQRADEKYCPSCGQRGVTVGLDGTLTQVWPEVCRGHACGVATYALPERDTVRRDAHSTIIGLRIGDSFTVRGRTYSLASYSGAGYADHFTVCVFANGGGTRHVKVRWDAVVKVGEHLT